MNLVLDVGNTLVKVGVFEKKQLIHFEQIKPQKISNILTKYSPEHILISDVRGIAQEFLSPLASQFSILFLTHQTSLPVQNLYKTPQTLGTDRIAGAIGAYFSEPSQNHLILDAGTCLTYDFIDKYGKYYGGNISLGLQMRFQALAHFTGKLPEIPFSSNSNTPEIPLIGQTTESAILSGVVNGMMEEIEGILKNYGQKFGDFQVTICGGDAKFLAKQIKAPIFASPNLVLFGLHQILLHNLKNSH